MAEAGVVAVTGSGTPVLEDAELVGRSRCGDTVAFDALVRRHQRRVWLVCRQYLGADEADAATQEAFVKAWTSLPGFDERAAFTTWLTRIAINSCLDELRRRRRQGRVLEWQGDGEDQADVAERVADEAADPETRARQRQTVQRLALAEKRLSGRQREIFRLRFYAGLELDDIAAAMGVHVGTVKTQLHRAVHRVRAELGDVR